MQWQPVAQNRLHKDPQRKNVDPRHDGFTPCRPPKSQRLIPHLRLLLLNPLHLLLLLLLPPFLIFEVSRRPLLLPAFVNELCAMLFESCDRVKGELVIGIYQLSGAGDDFRGYGLVGFEEVFGDCFGDGDEVSL